MEYFTIKKRILGWMVVCFFCGSPKAWSLSGFSFDLVFSPQSPKQDFLFHQTVGLVKRGDYLDSFKTFCTGVLIHSQVVLTARHCVTDCDGEGCQWAARSGRKERFHILKGSGVKHSDYSLRELQQAGGGSLRDVQDMIYFPWTSTWPKNRWKNDVALLYLQKPIQEKWEPFSFYTSSEVDKVQKVFYVAYGSHEVPGGVKSLFEGFQHGIEAPLLAPFYRIAIDPQSFQFQFVSHLNFLSTCKGDSGGPIFVKTSKGWSLLGITTTGKYKTYKVRENFYVKSDCGSPSYSVWLAPHLKWIRKVARSHWGLSVLEN